MIWTSRKRTDCLEILEAGLAAADPQRIIHKHVNDGTIIIGDSTIKTRQYSGVYVVAFGKAADSMTSAFNMSVLVNAGIVVIPKGYKSKILGKKFQIFNSGHPKPNKTSIKAAKEIMKFLKNRRQDELVVFLISGGGSSLLAIPNGISLDDKIRATDLLVKSGATIQEINCVRKHLSKIKGGMMVKDLQCQAISIIMSDVQGDDISSIASGPTYYNDTSTPLQAMEVIEKYNLTYKMPKSILERLVNAMPQTLQQKQPHRNVVENYIVAKNTDCLKAMKNVAQSKGYEVITTMQVFGEIKDAVKEIIKNVPSKPKTCLIFGGEVTVKVLGKGIGGRAQETVLRILKNTQGGKIKQKIVIASMGTDGIDGNTRHAGAITENVATDVDMIKKFLKNSDSGRFFQKHNRDIITGPTHTNLMDIGIILS